MSPLLEQWLVAPLNSKPLFRQLQHLLLWACWELVWVKFCLFSCSTGKSHSVPWPKATVPLNLSGHLAFEINGNADTIGPCFSREPISHRSQQCQIKWVTTGLSHPSKQTSQPINKLLGYLKGLRRIFHRLILLLKYIISTRDMVAYTVLADPTVSVVTGRGTHSALLRACSTDSWERSDIS